MTPVSGLAQTAHELGIDRSGLGNLSEAEQEKALKGMRNLNATWFRDGLGPINAVRLVKQNNLKMLAIVGPALSDYDGSSRTPLNGGEKFGQHCGWAQGSLKLSTINLDKFAQRLRATLAAVRAANLTIDAFEIGNEYDSMCFNGDVPDGHAASDQELKAIVKAYGELLKAAALAIREFFPQAKIITFGIAHGSDQWDNPPHHISRPARMIAMLRNIDGFNYLDNAQYHVDGYGTHIYPWSGAPAGHMTSILREDVAAIGTAKPYWVTEWGFLSAKDFPNQKGQSLLQATREMLTTFDNLGRTIPLGPLMFYSYNGWLTDSTGQLLPQANVLSAYAGKR